MDKEVVKEMLVDRGCEDSLLFEDPSYDTAIIGITEEGQVCYSFSKMIEYLCEQDGMSEDDALDFISYNTERSLPYFPKDKRPIIVYDDF